MVNLRLPKSFPEMMFDCVRQNIERGLTLDFRSRSEKCLAYL
jgi:hypothetical protein